tara:strand:+ start:1003 stop:1242 length:240 start_codon:yes stop_codon:yes gene_type:complete
MLSLIFIASVVVLLWYSFNETFNEYKTVIISVSVGAVVACFVILHLLRKREVPTAVSQASRSDTSRGGSDGDSGLLQTF